MVLEFNLRSMIRAVSILLVVLGTTASAADADSKALAVDRFMTDLHERGLFSGAVVVGTDKQVVYEEGFGFANVDAAVTFTPYTPTNISSLAKTFTAAALLSLEEEGKVELDTPVTAYLAEFPYPSVTIRHLLLHSSGLLPTAVYLAGTDPEGQPRDNDYLLDVLAEQIPPLSFEPGSAFQYSNAAYDLAALIIERVTGVSYASFLKERIFDPLSLDSTFIRPTWSKDWKGVPTLGYHNVDGALVAYELPDNQATYGSNLIRSSARDLYEWTRSFYTVPVLEESVLRRQLQAPQLTEEHESAINLLSWYFSSDGNRYYFTGVGQGFNSLAYWDARKKYSIVWVRNMSAPYPDVFLTSALIEILEGRPVETFEIPEFVELGCPPAMAWPSIDQLASLGGTWKIGSKRLTIGMREGINSLMEGWPLFAQIDDGLKYHIFPGEKELYVPGLDATIWFTDDDDGRVLHWSRLFDGTSTGEAVRD